MKRYCYACGCEMVHPLIADVKIDGVWREIRKNTVLECVNCGRLISMPQVLTQEQVYG